MNGREIFSCAVGVGQAGGAAEKPMLTHSRLTNNVAAIAVGVSGLCPDQAALWDRHRNGGATKYILSRSLVIWGRGAAPIARPDCVATSGSLV